MALERHSSGPDCTGLEFEHDDAVGALAAVGEGHAEAISAHDRLDEVCAHLGAQPRAGDADVAFDLLVVDRERLRERRWQWRVCTQWRSVAVGMALGMAIQADPDSNRGADGGSTRAMDGGGRMVVGSDKAETIDRGRRSRWIGKISARPHGSKEGGRMAGMRQGWWQGIKEAAEVAEQANAPVEERRRRPRRRRRGGGRKGHRGATHISKARRASLVDGDRGGTAANLEGVLRRLGDQVSSDRFRPLHHFLVHLCACVHALGKARSERTWRLRVVMRVRLRGDGNRRARSSRRSVWLT